VTSEEYPTGARFAGTDLALISEEFVLSLDSVGEWCVVGYVDVTCGVKVSG
jgi:hypothetical protein